MTYEDRVVTNEVTEPVAGERVVTTPRTVAEEQVVTTPRTVVEQRPAMRTTVTDDPVGNAYAASQMIGTIVWAVVVLVLLIVALWALHVYLGFF